MSAKPITIIFLDIEERGLIGIDHAEATPQQIANSLYLHRVGVDRLAKLFPDKHHVRFAFVLGHLTIDFVRANLPDDIFGRQTSIEEWQSASARVLRVTVAPSTDRN